MRKKGWSPHLDEELPGLLERRIPSIGAILNAYPEEKKFRWEVEMGDFYKHGSAKTLVKAQIEAEACLEKLLRSALNKLIYQ